MIFIELIFFLILTVFLFTIPGLILFRFLNLKTSNLECLTLSTIIGYLLYTIVSFLFHISGVPIIGLIITVSLTSLYFIFKLKPKIYFNFLYSKINVVAFIVCVVGVIGQLLVISPSGLKNKNQDIIFYSSNGHDGAWHIALANEIAKGSPIQNPSIAGEKLFNYHFFSDITLSDFNHFLLIDSKDLYFRFFPLLFSILLGLTSYQLGKLIGKGKSAGLWSMVITYFAGSFGYIATFIKNGSIGGESIFWGTQIQSSSGNPPQIISNIFFLTLLFIFIKYIKLKKTNIKLAILLILITGFLSEFKIYASIVFIPSLAIVGVIRFIKEKRLDLLFIAFLSGIISLITYLPYTKGGFSFLIFQPWWFIRTMIAEPGRLNWVDLELRRQTYLSENNIKRVLSIEFSTLLIFIVGNLGIRIIGFYYFIEKRLKNILHSYFSQLLLFITVIGFIFPLIFLQKGVAGNTAQTLQYPILVMGILTGITISKMLSSIKHKLIRILLVLLILLISIPTQVGLLHEFYSKPPLTSISASELEALDFLKEYSNKDSVILTPAYDQYSIYKDKKTPDIWAWFDTSYVPAFSKRRTYLSDFEQMDIMGYDIDPRINFQKELFNSSNDLNLNELTKRNINYIYFNKEQSPKRNLEQLNLSKEFDNQKVEIWKVN